MAALLLGVSMVQAAISPADLTPEAVAATISSMEKTERAAYAKEVIAAVDALPISEEEKTEMFVTMTRVLISAGATTDVLAEIYNSMPIEHLPAVAEMLAGADFQQTTNEMTDEQYNALVEKITESSAAYIEVSGTDSPAVRLGILAATFTKGSSNPAATQERVIAAMPESMQAAVATYVEAATTGNTDVLAAAAGVDAINEAPEEDPDADRVVQADESAEDAGDAVADTGADADDAGTEVADADEAPAAETEAPVADADTPAADDEGGVKVPLLSRYSHDVIGITIDTLLSTMYDWEAECEIGNTLPTMAFGETETVVGVDEQVPTGGGSTTPQPAPVTPEPPSPTYANQVL